MQFSTSPEPLIVDRDRQRKARPPAAVVCDRDPVVARICRELLSRRALGKFHAAVTRADVPGQPLSLSRSENVTSSRSAREPSAKRCRRPAAREPDPRSLRDPVRHKNSGQQDRDRQACKCLFHPSLLKQRAAPLRRAFLCFGRNCMSSLASEQGLADLPRLGGHAHLYRGDRFLDLLEDLGFARHCECEPR